MVRAHWERKTLPKKKYKYKYKNDKYGYKKHKYKYKQYKYDQRTWTRSNVEVRLDPSPAPTRAKGPQASVSTLTTENHQMNIAGQWTTIWWLWVSVFFLTWHTDDWDAPMPCLVSSKHSNVWKTRSELVFHSCLHFFEEINIWTEEVEKGNHLSALPCPCTRTLKQEDFVVGWTSVVALRKLVIGNTAALWVCNTTSALWRASRTLRCTLTSVVSTQHSTAWCGSSLQHRVQENKCCVCVRGGHSCFKQRSPLATLVNQQNKNSMIAQFILLVAVATCFRFWAGDWRRHRPWQTRKIIPPQHILVRVCMQTTRGGQREKVVLMNKSTNIQHLNNLQVWHRGKYVCKYKYVSQVWHNDKF